MDAGGGPLSYRTQVSEMWKILVIVSALAGGLLIGTPVPAPSGPLLALGGPSPDESTGPYNPAPPRDDASGRLG
jgi:hypothetical protein